MGPPRYGRQARLKTRDWKLETSKTQFWSLVEFGRSFLGSDRQHFAPCPSSRQRLNSKRLRLPFTLTCTRRGVTHSPFTATPARRTQGYRIKPHGQLVSVSLSAYTPSTPDLSTSWSWTTLQGGQASGKSHLGAGFPLRCFQRLSLPHIATRQCHWRDNRYTRDASTPVLSY